MTDINIMSDIEKRFIKCGKNLRNVIQHISEKKKTIEKPIDTKYFEKFYQELEKISFKDENNKSKKPCLKIYEYNSNPNVCLKIFQDSDNIFEYNNTNAMINVEAKILDDVFVVVIDLNNVKISKDCGFSINTGILIDKTKKNYVLIPKFNQLNKISPIISVSDGDTYGPLTVNGFANEDIYGKFEVEYMAYNSYKIDECLNIVDKYSEKSRLIKSKDSKDARFTINCGIGIDFDDFVHLEDNLEFKTFELNVSPKINLEKQKLILKLKKGKTIIFSSRDREWYDEKLQTVSGLWNEETLLKPMVGNDSVYEANVFCLTLIGARIKLNYKVCKFDESKSKDVYLSSKLNGSFIYLTPFKNLRKYMGKINKNLEYYSITSRKEIVEKTEKFMKNIEEEMKQVTSIPKLTEVKISNKRSAEETAIDAETENLECVATKLARLDDTDKSDYNFELNEFSNGFNNIKFIPGKIYELGPNFVPLRERQDRIAPSTDNEYKIFLKSCEVLREAGYLDSNKGKCYSTDLSV